MQSNKKVIVEKTNENDEPNTLETLIKIEIHPVESKFVEFFATKSFVDCILELSSEQIHCHRLILAKYSNVFRSYFIKHDTTDNKLLPPPYVISDKALSQIIDFCYKSTISVDSSNIVDVFITSAMYGIKVLTALLSESLLNILDNGNILDYLPKFKIQLTDEAIQNFPELLDNYRDLRDNIGGICDIISKNFAFISRSKFIDNTPLYMLPDILKKIDYKDLYDTAVFESKDDFVLYTIDKIVGDSEISTLDKECLSKAIEWDQENSYLYLTKYRLNWVLPSILRPILAKVFKSRQKTIQKVDKIVGKLKSKIHSNFGVLDLLQIIYASKGETKVESKNVLSVLSTMWGTTSITNPALSGFVQLTADTDGPLSSFYDPRNVFVQDDYSYLTNSTCDYQNPEFTHYQQKLTLGFVFDKTVGNKVIPSNLKIDEIKYHLPESVKKETSKITIMYDTNNPGTGIKLVCKPSKDQATYNIFSMHVKYVEIIGKFELE
ncbi:BTB/POZ domain containing protein [Trichomonas vaginalis G3]|uniref:BTB/POZ domain containing protein n=1 Tax=Trichomonas vaginalis (strain ATCC PRA-98 / G3) TaxID=412133 RepID=A2EV78_TRIV3|nr:LD33804P family [Trichomonas vaginalis G3]EAY03461.1 BTB/POZ domain containing protein [Trichomonas vaginalis G3]KAI5486195.1 LD33804P family [Trichomonas vaginalis G3]|eukprot:XP_001315684.1 BTB/POZ domain containing protein [Trichomonas vaginalis G3]